MIASSAASFLDPHVSVGQVSASETIGLARKVAFERVMRMALLGRHERLSPEQAYRLGMVSDVVDPPERLRAAAQELALAIAEQDPELLQARKRALWDAVELGLSQAYVQAAGRSRLRTGSG